MAKPKKFNLSANPTFKSSVAIPIPGGESVDIEFIFKHRSKQSLQEFLGNMTKKEDVELIQDMASGWDIDDPFDEESLEKLMQNYPGSGRAIIQTYIMEMSGAAKQKN